MYFFKGVQEHSKEEELGRIKYTSKILITRDKVYAEGKNGEIIYYSDNYLHKTSGENYGILDSKKINIESPYIIKFSGGMLFALTHDIMYVINYESLKIEYEFILFYTVISFDASSKFLVLTYNANHEMPSYILKTYKI